MDVNLDVFATCVKWNLNDKLKSFACQISTLFLTKGDHSLFTDVHILLRLLSVFCFYSCLRCFYKMVVCASEACLFKHASHVSCNAAVLGANEVSSQSTRLLMFSHLCTIMAMGTEKKGFVLDMALFWPFQSTVLCSPEGWTAYFYFCLGS